MGEVGVVFAGVVEDLEGEVEVLLAADHRDEAFGGEALGPGFDWGSDGVGFEEGGFRVHGGEVVVRWVVCEGIGGDGANSGGSRTDGGD